jgi:hypothetical protein
MFDVRKRLSELVRYDESIITKADYEEISAIMLLMSAAVLFQLAVTGKQ